MLLFVPSEYSNLSLKLALKWLENSYNLDENPGMGIQGLYYYYQAMSKALSAMGIDTLTLEDGRKVDSVSYTHLHGACTCCAASMTAGEPPPPPTAR